MTAFPVFSSGVSAQLEREFKTFTEVEEEHMMLQQPRSAIQYFL